MDMVGFIKVSLYILGGALMSKKTRVLFALSIALSIGIISIAYASYSAEIYIPLSMNNARLITPTPTEIPEVIINHIEPGGYWQEYVRVKNRTTDEVELTGWTIKSEKNGKTYTFSKFFLESNDTVKVWSQPGTDTDTDVFWGSMTEVWDDKSDCARLGDENNELVQWYCYE